MTKIRKTLNLNPTPSITVSLSVTLVKLKDTKRHKLTLNAVALLRRI
jgi:hypothetical protein